MKAKRLIGWMAVLSLLVFAGTAGADDRDMEEKRERLKAAKAELNGLEWKIKLNPMGQTKAQTYEDTLVFTNPSRISSEKLEFEGLPPSNYTVSLKGEDVIVWETMQTSESAGLAFWHGELKNDVMRGVLSRHPDEKTHLDFSFYSIERREFLPKLPKAEEIKEEPAPEPAKPEPAALIKDSEDR